MSSRPRGQCEVIACFSTSLGVLKAFMHPDHSHKKGRAGLGLGTGTGLGTDDALTDEVEEVGDSAAVEDEDVEPVGEVNTAAVVTTGGEGEEQLPFTIEATGGLEIAIEVVEVVEAAVEVNILA